MLEPVVRLMVPCEDARPRKGSSGKLDLFGILSTINSRAEAFPVALSFCVYLCLSNGRGHGKGKIRVIDAETQDEVYPGELHEFDFGSNPISIVGASIRIPSCTFPTPGLYHVQFVYNDVLLSEFPIFVRETR